MTRADVAGTALDTETLTQGLASSVRRPDIALAEHEPDSAPQLGFEEGLQRTLTYVRNHPDVVA